MQSEPAVTPRVVEAVAESVSGSCPAAGSSVMPLAATPARARLRLVSADDDLTTPTPAPVAWTVAPQRAATPTRDDDVVPPPLADPLAVTASALWSSPADVLGLLAAASEHRRVVDLIWNAAQIGALQLPPALLAAVERARASWPQALPA